MDMSRAFTDLRAFLREAGAFALQAQQNLVILNKDNGEALTETDLAVSRMAMEKLGHWLALPRHKLVDEEFIKETPVQVFAENDYLWVLDPIDGTAGYSFKRCQWGISLALLHKGQPVLGGIIMPAMDILLLTDGESSWQEDMVTGEKTSLQSLPEKVSSQMFVETYFATGIEWGKTFSGRKIWPNTPESAVQGIASTLCNQAVAATLITGFSIWDVAGALALAKPAGFKILSMDDGREWKEIIANDFQPNWKLAQSWLLCHPDNYAVIADAIKHG